MKQTKQQPEAKAASKVVTKQDIFNHMNGWIAVSVAYSGNDNTFFFTGADAMKAELSVLKAFPGMPFKTQSSTLPVNRKKEAKQYYFRPDGTHTHVKETSNVVFDCLARDDRNAKRKFGNYITSLTKPASAVTGSI
jgi:hypothetical protein